MWKRIEVVITASTRNRVIQRWVRGFESHRFRQRNLLKQTANDMKGVSLIATPIVATIGFLFMSTVIKQIGLVQTMSDAVGPVLSVSPVLILFGVAFLTGFLTQSYAAYVSVLVPMLQVVLQTGADPFAACFAAASGASLIQYFLTGGPVAALATVIPVIPGSDLKTANAFQRPSILAGCLVAFIITAILAL